MQAYALADLPTPTHDEQHLHESSANHSRTRMAVKGIMHIAVYGPNIATSESSSGPGHNSLIVPQNTIGAANAPDLVTLASSATRCISLKLEQNFGH